MWALLKPLVGCVQINAVSWCCEPHDRQDMMTSSFFHTLMMNGAWYCIFALCWAAWPGKHDSNHALAGMEGGQLQSEPFWDMFQRVCASSGQVCISVPALVHVPVHACPGAASQMSIVHTAAASHTSCQIDTGWGDA